MRRRYRILGGTAALAFVLDQLSKWWVLAAIPEHRPVPVFPGFFDLINIRHRMAILALSGGHAGGRLGHHRPDAQFPP